MMPIRDEYEIINYCKRKELSIHFYTCDGSESPQH